MTNTGVTFNVRALPPDRFGFVEYVHDDAKLPTSTPDVVVSAAMPLHVVLTVGPNTLDVTGDMPFTEVIELATRWLSAVAPGSVSGDEQAKIDALNARVKAQVDALSVAVTDDSVAKAIEEHWRRKVTPVND